MFSGDRIIPIRGSIVPIGTVDQRVGIFRFAMNTNDPIMSVRVG